MPCFKSLKYASTFLFFFFFINEMHDSWTLRWEHFDDPKESEGNVTLEELLENGKVEGFLKIIKNKQGH